MPLHRWLISILGLVVSAGPAVGAAAPRWVKVVAPEFTVVTSLNEKEAAAWAGDFAQYVAALQSLFHARVQALPPLTIVLFARERDFNPYRPLGEKGKVQEVAGFFLRHESWAVAGLAGAQLSEDERHTIFHEGVHWFLSAQERPNPVWLEEGVAEVFSTFTVTKAQAEWGRPIENHVRLLNYERPLPLERLLLTARGDLFGDDTERTSMVYAQSWAFVHFVLFGKRELPRQALPTFLAAVQKGTERAAAFQEAFGRDYAAMDTLLERYLRSGEYFVRRVPVLAVEPPKIQPAAPADVADALARLALAGRHFDEAVNQARAAIAAAPDDPRGYEVLGLALKAQEKNEAALEAFNRAIEKGTRDFQPHFEVGMAEQNAAFGPGGSGTLGATEARRIANRYERAINLRPLFLPVYQNLAGVIGIAEPWGPEDRRFFEFGLNLYPGDPMIRLGLAILTHRSGDTVAARAQVAAVLAAPDLKSPARSFGRRLEDAWESQEAMAEIQKLVDARKFAEALALIDRTLAGEIATPLRSTLVGMRSQLEVGRLTVEFDQALQGGRWNEARRAAAQILESNAPFGVKAQVRRMLGELDRKKLGTN